jgi:cobalt-precorrin-7 (C5)-methyltransferase
MHKITVIGVGPGGRESLTGAAQAAIIRAEVLLGGRRHLETFASGDRETFALANNLIDAVQFIKDRRHLNVAVLATGDPGMYGILDFLRRHFEPEDIEVIPGISAVQEAFARLAMPWQDAVILSAHGRDTGALVEIIKNSSKVAVLTGPESTPVRLAGLLTEAGLGERASFVCTDLTLPGEKVTGLKIKDLTGNPEGNRHNCVMVIVDE